MSHKEITRDSYQETAERFARNVASLAPMESIQRFVSMLPPNPRIIDIGCGSGRDAKVFSENGVSVVGIDFCQSLIDIAKKTAPLAQFQMMDIETDDFPEASFDGAWASCSLLHIPKKSFSPVLCKIHSCLKENGYFYLTLKKGTGEFVERDLRYGDFEKFWALYEENELKELLQSAKFKIIDCNVVEARFSYQTHPSVRVFCQKD